jgi:ankyrin repeat protein
MDHSLKDQADVPPKSSCSRKSIKKGVPVQRRGADRDIYEAARMGAVEQMEYILRRTVERAKLVNTPDLSGALPLHLAAAHGQEKVVILLLGAHANVNQFEHDEHGKKTALHWAAFKGYPSIVQLLLDCGANIEAKTNDGETALMAAAIKGHKAIVQLLLESGANIEAKTNDGKTVLMFAAINGYEATVQLLLKSGANIEAKTNDGQTALMFAAINGHEATVQLLL